MNMKQRVRETGRCLEGEQSPAEMEQEQLNNVRADQLTAVQELQEKIHGM